MSYLNKKYNNKEKYTRFYDFYGKSCTIYLSVKLSKDDFNIIVDMVECAYSKGYYEGRANIQWEIRDILGINLGD